jgi:phosphoribosylglycinamide formyltransferase-1
MKNIIIFASGRGSNAKNIIDYFRDTKVKVSLIVSDNPYAGVLDIAAEELITTTVISKDTLGKYEFVEYLKSFNPSLIILAGFLKKIPINMVKAFENKIVNIHPSLLPKYGGKGMYGENIHKAVIEAKESKSGITIHYVNENYDEGKVIFKASCKIKETDDVKVLENKIHHLEHLYFPEIIDSIVNKIKF